MDTLRIGMVGTGIMGQLHARVFSEYERSRVTALCSLEHDRCRALADTYKVDAVHGDVEAMVADENVDALCLALPDHLHAAVTVAAAEAGKHVLTEKPLATTVADAERMVEAANQAGVKLMTQYSHRWVPAYWHAKKRIADGDAGAPRLVSARKNNPIWVATDMISWAAETTPASFLSTHDIDLTLWWLDDVPDRVYAHEVRSVLKARGIDTPDAVQGLVHFKGGAIASFEACWIYPNSAPSVPDSYMHVVCENETLKLEREVEQVIQMSEKFTYPRNTLAFEMDGKIAGAVVHSLRHFVDCVLDDKPVSITPASSLTVVRIIDGFERSIASGEAVLL